MKDIISNKIIELEKKEQECEQGVKDLDARMDKIKELYKVTIIQKETLKKLLLEYNKEEENRIKRETKKEINLEEELQKELELAKEQEMT